MISTWAIILFLMRKISQILSFFLLALAVIACRTNDSDLDSFKKYRDQLTAFRAEFAVKEMPDVPFFLFGMGNRVKLLYKNGQVIHSFSGKVLKEWDVDAEIIIPNLFKVKLKTKKGTNVIISEDEGGVFIQEGKVKELVEGTNFPVNLPAFNDHPYSEILKVLHQELLVNIYDSKPVPNYFVYQKPWRRDAAMMAMCFEKTGNLDLIRDWVLSIDDPYDHNNKAGGVPENEADNLGQSLYLVSLFGDKDHPVVQKIIDELPALEVTENNKRYILGRSDFQEVPVYQTKWLKFGLESMGLEDPYSIPPGPDNYSSLFWWDYHAFHAPNENNWRNDCYPYIGWARDHFNGIKKSPISNQDYPLTWEIKASQADYGGMAIIDDIFVEQQTSVPHTWHAAEVFLYLLDEEMKLSE